MYCEYIDIVNTKLPSDLIILLCDDESLGSDNPHIQERVNAAIKAACDEIDGQLTSIYDTPLPDHPMLRDIAAKIAAFRLCRRRTGSTPDDVVTDYKEAIKLLALIRDMKVKLFTDKSPTVGGPRLTSKTDGDKVFPTTGPGGPFDTIR